MKSVPVVSLKEIDPQVLEHAFRCLRTSHTIEHRAIAALKGGAVTQAKIELQNQIQVLVSVLAML